MGKIKEVYKSVSTYGWSGEQASKKTFMHGNQFLEITDYTTTERIFQNTA